MAGVKRSFDSENDGEEEAQQSPYLPMFETFRAELDDHHDRRERIIKASRDITAMSKKAIFSLHRAQELNNALPDKLAKDVQCKREGIHGLFKTVIPDLQGINAWRYQRQISPGYQEYIEATSFQHYLETGKLLTMNDLASSLPAEVPPASEEDHVLGLFDLTGEMMRFAITSTATHGKLPTSHHRLTSKHPGDAMEVDQVNDSARRTSLTDLQELRNCFEMLDPRGNKQLGKDYEQKVKVMKTSVEKVENVAYGIAVRKGERPAGWVPDMPAGPRVDVEAAA